MDINPLSIDVVTVKHDALSKIKAIAAIDCGSTYTNIVYKNEDADSSVLSLCCARFDNKNVTSALEWLKQHAKLPEHGVINLTGRKSVLLKSTIEDFFKLQTENIGTTISQIRGIQFLLQNTPNLPDLLYEDIEPPKNEIKGNENMEALLKQMNAEFHRNEGENFEANPLPSMCGFLDSTFTFQMVSNETKVQFGSKNWFGNKMFKEFAHLMLQTQDYEEIMDLASKGDRKKIDTTIGDVLADDPNSPYGRFPSDLPLFVFGKLADWNKSVEGLSREDKAASLLALTILCFQNNIIQLSKRCGISRAYLAGEFVQSLSMRTALANNAFLMGSIKFDVKILKSRHVAAIGSLITDNEDVEHFLKVNKAS